MWAAYPIKENCQNGHHLKNIGQNNIISDVFLFLNLWLGLSADDAGRQCKQRCYTVDKA